MKLNYLLRPVILCICFYLECSFSFSQTVNDEASFFNCTHDKTQIIRNKIASTQIKMFADGELYSIQTFYFDSLGLPTRQLIADSTGKINVQFEFSHDFFGGLLFRGQKDFNFNKTDSVIFFKSYYDSLLVRESSSQSPNQKDYFYDSQRQKIKTKTSLISDKVVTPISLTTFSYDSLNRIIKTQERRFNNSNDKDGTITSDRELYYGKNGKIVLDKELMQIENLVSSNKGTVKYFYDKKNNLITISYGNGTKSQLFYDDKGLIIIKKSELLNDNQVTFIQDVYTYTYR